MKTLSLYLFPLCLLLFNFQCDEECEAAYSTVSIAVETRNSSLIINDTLWLFGDFSADVALDTKISENGGLFVAHLFRPDTTTGVLSSARGAFTTLSEDGLILDNRPGLDEDFGVYWRYSCPNQQCGFRIGLLPREAGTYLIQVQGLGYDVTLRSDNCLPSNYHISQTSLEAPAGLSDRSVLGNDFTTYRYELTAVSGERFIDLAGNPNFSDYIVITVN